MTYYRQSPFANLTPVVKNLLIINIIFYLAKVMLAKVFDMDRYFSVFYFNSPLFNPWQLITHMFMHVDHWHLIFNMFGLFMFGPMLENYMGSKRFFNFYFIAGLGSIFLNMAIQAFVVYQVIGTIYVPHGDISMFYNTPGFDALQGVYGSELLGASGAIFGVLAGFGMLFPNVELMLLFFPVPVKAKYLISIYILFEVASAFHIFNLPGDNVAHIAHLGGALFGFIMIKAWGMHSYKDY